MAALLLLAVPSVALAAPTNDNFPGLTISGWYGARPADTNVDATMESGEPFPTAQPDVGASVWYSWTPTFSRAVTIDTAGSDFDTVLGVYTGMRTNLLTELVSNDDADGGTTSRLGFYARSGTTYRIQVSGLGGATGNVVLHWLMAPANDDFLSGTAISGLSGSRAADNNVAATMQSGEPIPTAQPDIGASVWYSWTPSVTRAVAFDTVGSDFNTVLGVYTGAPADGLPGLAEVASDDDSGGDVASRVGFVAVAGTTYRIQVSGYQGATGNIALHWVTAPSNDDFRGLTISGLSGSRTTDTVAATLQQNEPVPAAQPDIGASVWYSWTPAASCLVTIDTIGSDFNTVLGVYTGSAFDEPLVEVASDDDSGGDAASQVSFIAAKNTPYRIQVSGYQGATGSLTVNWLGIAGPVNDDFPGLTISGLSGTRSADTNVDATLLPNEAVPTAQPDVGASVWYTWTPTASCSVTIDTAGSGFDTALGIYTGSAIDALTEVASNDDSNGDVTSQVSFTAIKNTPYRIQVSGVQGATGPLSMHWVGVLPPSNDDFPGLTISGLSGSRSADTNVGATLQPDELLPTAQGDVGASVWYSWTPTVSSMATFDTMGSGFDTVLGVYTGSTVDALTEVVSNDDVEGASTSQVSFVAAAGTTYRIQVTGFQAAVGKVAVHWTAIPGPSNDDFPGFTISGASGSRTTDTVAATLQPNEPAPSAQPDFGASVWYSWTPTASCSVTIDTIGSNFNTVLGVYTGSPIDSLTEVVSDDDSGGDGASQVSFAASKNTTYRIQVSGYQGATGSLAVNWASVAGPPNDDFPGLNLTGLSGSRTMDTALATLQPDEPMPSAQGDVGASVWYSWTPSVSYPATFDTIGSNFDTVLGVYTGATIDALTEVASDDDGGGNSTSQLTFLPVAGTTYRIQISGFQGATGDVVMHWAVPDAPGVLLGTVRSSSGSLLSSVTVTLGSLAPTTTASNGTYRFKSVAPGTYTATLAKSGYTTQTSGVTISAGATTSLDATLWPAASTHRLRYLADAHSSIVGSGTQIVSHNASGSSVTASAAVGYHFLRWSDGATSATRTDANVAADATYTANSEINAYTLKYAPGAHGTLSGTISQTVNYLGSGTAVTANANTGYHFVNWSDGVLTATRTDTSVAANVNVTANFAATTFALRYAAGANGTLSGTASQTVDYLGSGTAVTANANTGYHFVKWSDDLLTPTRTDTNVTSAVNVTADFAINTFTVTPTTALHGTISSAQTVNYLASAAFTVTPETGYRVTRVWLDAGTDLIASGGFYTVTNVAADHTISATFDLIPVYTTKLSRSGATSVYRYRTYKLSGSVTSSPTPAAPASGSVKIIFKRYYSGKWRQVGSTKYKTLYSGKYTYSYKPGTRGSWRAYIYYAGKATGSAVYKSASTVYKAFKVK